MSPEAPTTKDEALPHREIRKRSVWWGCLIAVLGTLVAATVRWSLLQAIDSLPLYITFYPVVFAAAVVGGTKPGVLATILSAIIADVFFIEPVGVFSLRLADAIGMAFFTFINVGVSLLGGQLRKQSEALREREEWFRTLADAIPQFTWIARPDGHLFWFNKRCFEYLGSTQEQAEGWGWLNAVDPEVRPLVLERWRHSIATGEPYEVECRMRGVDGIFRPFLNRAVPLRNKEGRVELWFGASMDITDLRERERALRRQARLIDLAPAATMVLRPDGTITFWSHGADQLYGWTAAEAVGRRSRELLRTEGPEPFEARVAGLQKGGTWSGELRHQDRKGNQIVVESYWLAELNAHGELEEILESNTDITERKRLHEHLEDEVQARTAEVRRAFAELEYMSYSMIHDMRAPLRAMQSFAHILQEKVRECQRPPAVDYLRRIGESALRLDRLVMDALNYNRLVREQAVITPVNVGKLLRGMIDSYPNLHSRIADIALEFADLWVLGNESLLTQCFGNLLDNAAKFVASGVRPSVRVWAEEIESPAPGHDPSSNMVRICVQDNGIGIPAAALESIFQMFHRIHGEGEYPGTGIGLAIVQKTVERMNGHLGLESTPGRGSKFWIELPKPLEVQRLELAAALAE